jgi:hypothetical protein
VLSGTADLDRLVGRAPHMESLDTEPVQLTDVEVLQAAFEHSYSSREAVLPAGLHPTTPPLVIFLVWKVGNSPWGSFSMAQARVSCRSGVRPRGFVVGAIIDNLAAAAGLASRFGLPGRHGVVSVQRRYDGIELIVSRDGRMAVHLVGLDPDPLRPEDVQFSVTTTLARTSRGLRLIQVEPEYDLSRVERVRPQVVAFEAAAWEEPLLHVRHPVSATISVGDLTIPRLRYLSRPDVVAFEGTEKV